MIQDQKNACGNVSPSVTRNHSIFGDVSFRMQEVISVWSQIVADTVLGRKFADGTGTLHMCGVTGIHMSNIFCHVCPHKMWCYKIYSLPPCSDEQLELKHQTGSDATTSKIAVCFLWIYFRQGSLPLSRITFL